MSVAERSAEITFTLNGKAEQVSNKRRESLLDLLRRMGLYSVKFGCREGDCGMCTVLLDGNPVRSCMVKAWEVNEHSIMTLEGLIVPGKRDPQAKLHPIQQAFIETGAIQCGFCTPAQILIAKALLDKNPNPDETEIRQAMSGVLCRCTGYVRTTEAVLRAAAMMRGEKVAPVAHIDSALPGTTPIKLPLEFYRQQPGGGPLPPLVFTPPEMDPTSVVGKSEVKVDAVKLAKGYPVFTDDIELPGMLYGALLTSPHAHARIKRIDASKARALPGVHAVLTHEDLPRIKYASGGQSYPQPEPYDQVCLDNKVRHIGDRVAVLAAETPEIADQAIRLIEVEYELLTVIVDMETAMRPGAPVIHDETDTKGIHDAKRNIVHHINAEVGDVEAAFAKVEHIYEGEYRTPKQQHAHMETHTCITFWDEDERLVVRSSTQVPFHVRRIIAPLIGLPVKRIRVIKPRIGGGFGNKQEILLEDLCAHLTLATGRPVRLECTRRQEFTSSRSRHPQVIRYKVGITQGKVEAIDLYVLADTGAYGTHGLTVQMVGGFKGLTLYNPPNARFTCDVVYTNKPPAGAFRGYGTMQETFALEVLMEEIAEKLGLDVVEFKRGNVIKTGDPMYLATELGEGRKGQEQTLESSAIEQCIAIGLEATHYYKKREANHRDNANINPIKRGIGMAIAMHGSGVAGLDMAAATLKMNDDGSFNLLVGATDIGTGSDTILAQIAAEVLGSRVDDFIVYSSDTDFTPFDKGAYASSTTYLSGGAVYKAAMQVRHQIQEHAAPMLSVAAPEQLMLRDRKVFAPDGRSVTLAEVALDSLHWHNQHQIMATASHMSFKSPPPTAAQFVEATVDIETGEIKVERLLMVVDCGRVINPITAAGQVEGGMAQGLGFAHCEDMFFDEKGQITNARLGPYRVYKANEMPLMDVIFVQTDEPNGPYGAKSVAEIAIDAVAPALVSAVHDATGVWIRELPLTPDRVWVALRKGK
jgi:putative selenate reductase molybdopterin-binding subunit